jgi:primary-amine oxidase
MKARKLLWGSLIVTAALTGFARSAAAQCVYSEATSIYSTTYTFPAGSKWTINVSRGPCEGLILSGLTFQAQGGEPMIVLSSARIAQIHVPYATGTPRFLDITTDTTGLGSNSIPLLPGECANPLFTDGSTCIQAVTEGYGWKYNVSYRQQSMLVVFMSSQMGQYTYINRWEFHDDGTIEVKLGLTGALQIVKSGAGYVPYGGRLNPQSDNSPAIGLAHWHNVYYRLDFDIAGAGNDRVDQVTWVPSTTGSPDGSCTTFGKCGTISFSPILTESARTWSPTAATSWYVYDKAFVNADGRSVGYWLVPNVAGLHRGMTTSSEPWSGSELWVTNYNTCELYAVANQSPSLPPGCSGAATHVGAMTNGGSVDGADLVVWYRNSLLHVPRDEDQDLMPIEWMAFEIQPRSFHYQNPAPDPTF